MPPGNKKRISRKKNSGARSRRLPNTICTLSKSCAALYWLPGVVFALSLAPRESRVPARRPRKAKSWRSPAAPKSRAFRKKSEREPASKGARGCRKESDGWLHGRRGSIHAQPAARRLSHSLPVPLSCEVRQAQSVWHIPRCCRRRRCCSALHFAWIKSGGPLDGLSSRRRRWIFRNCKMNVYAQEGSF